MLVDASLVIKQKLSMQALLIRNLLCKQVPYKGFGHQFTTLRVAELSIGLVRRTVGLLSLSCHGNQQQRYRKRGRPLEHIRAPPFLLNIPVGGARMFNDLPLRTIHMPARVTCRSRVACRGHFLRGVYGSGVATAMGGFRSKLR